MAEGAKAYKSIYTEVTTKLDMARFVPVLAPGIQSARLVTRHGEVYYVLKNPQAHKYLKIDERDFFIFERIDGRTEVRHLVLDFFRQYKSFGFQRASALMAELRNAMFLANASARLYDEIARKAVRSRWAAWAKWAWETFLRRQFAVGGLDGIVTRVYNGAGRFFFTTGALALSALITVAGLVFFAALVHAGKLNFVKTADSYVFGLVVLILIDAVVILLHESAHALATKHYGREVNRGGAMLYFGMPAFFVDTSDMYLSPARQRIAVSWAGPGSELVLGGLASMAAWYCQDWALGSVLFKFAVFFYLGVFMNMNPLMELDGYYILEDLTEIPNLRRRALTFVRGGLWQKFSRREKLSAEECFFSVFGALAALYSVFVVVLAVYLIHSRLLGAVRDLARQGGVVSWTLIFLLIVAVAVPIAFMIVMRIITLVAAIFRFAMKRHFFRSTAKVAAALAVFWGVALAASRWWDLGDTVNYTLAALAALAAAGGLISAGRFFAGSSLRLVLTLIGLAAMALAVGYGEVAVRYRFNLHSAALLAVLLTAAALVETARKARFARAAILWQALGVLAAWLALPGLRNQGAEGEKLAAFLALIVFLPHVGDYLFGTFRAAALSLAAGFALGTCAIYFMWMPLTGLAGAVAGLAGAVALLAGAVLVVQIQENLAAVKVPDTRGLELDDAARLRLAALYLAEGVLEHVEAIGGRKLRVRRRLGSILAESHSGLAMTKGRIEFTGESGILDSTRDAALLLRRVSELGAQALGKPLVQRILRDLFERMEWQEREVLSAYVLKDVELAASAANDFSRERSSRRALLEANPLFAGMEPEELQETAAAFAELEFADGRQIVREGETGDRFYLIASGQVEVSRRQADGRPARLAILEPGDYFGEIALLKDVPRTATCAALGPVRALALDRSAFGRLVRSRFELLGKFENAAALTAMVRKMPLFSEFPPKDLALIVRSLKSVRYGDGAAVIRQGDHGSEFYIVQSGEVRVAVGTETGEEKTVAKIGPGDYFGEIALLEDRPRTASVYAVGEVELAVLSRQDFEQLIAGQMSASRLLSQTGSRRIMDTRHKVA